MDIQASIEYGVKWNGRYLRPSKHAIREMIQLGMDLYDVVDILDNKDAEDHPRGKDTIEKILKVGKTIYNVVVMESYAYDIDEDIWLILHVGGK